MIAAGLHAESRDILLQFARFEKQGTLPNMIRGGDDSNRDTSDAPLWLFIACRDLVAAEGNHDFLQTDCGGRSVLDALQSIARAYTAGTPNGIAVDPASGLVFSPSHFTWMDTNFPAGTPREGYPVEIQALWFAALDFLAALLPDSSWPARARQVQSAINTLFPLDNSPYLADCLLAPPGTPAADATPDDALRPNQLLAITLGAVTDRTRCEQILAACEALLVPGAIRSLADAPVTVPLPVRRDGTLLNDPRYPYWGQYRGDEDTRRKPAYHNGTAWTWPFPSYPEALVMTYGDSAIRTARALLGSSEAVRNAGCLGHIPEVLDGNTPHAQRGCGAQAWGASELHRVVALLAAAG